MPAALVIQYAMRIPHMLSCVTCPALPIFFYVIPYAALFSIKKIVEIKVLISLQLLSETFLIPRKIQRDTIKRNTTSCKAPFILVRFLRKVKCLDTSLIITPTDALT